MPKPSTIERHPQKQKIIEALLGGESVRSIAGWAFPPVSFLAVQRYKATIVRPAVERSSVRVRNLNRVKNQKVTPVSVEEKTEAIHAIQDAPVLAIRDARLRLLQDMVNRLQIVMDERAQAHPDAPGGKSGLIVRDFKGLQPVYRVDGVVLSEARELCKQISQELGQWVVREDVTVKAEVSSVAVTLASVMSQAELRALEQRALAAQKQQQLAAGPVVEATAEVVQEEKP